MNWIVAGLVAVAFGAPAALACESYVEDVRRAAADVRTQSERLAEIQARYSELGSERDDILYEVEVYGPFPAWEQSLGWVDASMIDVRLEWDAVLPEAQAADASLTAALDAHVGACGVAARPGALLEEAGLYVD